MNTSSKTARGRTTAVKSQIDENLKRVYESALNEDVPDRFKLLLEQLKSGAPVPSIPLDDSPLDTAAAPKAPLPHAAASQDEIPQIARMQHAVAPLPQGDVGAASETAE